MFTSNPFAALTDFLPPLVMQVYVILMILAVAVGTWFDTYHKGSAIYYRQRKEKAKAIAERELNGSERASIVLRTIGEAAVSGEFHKWPRRTSHLLTMWGFLLYVITTVVMVFAYSTAAQTPTTLVALWVLGALMILVGGFWFFFFLRVNVAFDGDPPYHLGRADIFIGSLLASAAFALIWHFVQAASGSRTAILIFFGLYIFFTTLLFVSVPWSKFAHMFYKPAVAYQRKIEEADGSSDLPSAAYSHHSRK